MKAVWPEGYGREIFAELDSTNAQAARMAETLSGPTWILALNQTTSRGRRGRAWAFPKGNFAATLLMHPEEAAAQAALRSFVASLALHDACVAVTGRAEGFALKWPNDVLLNGGKLAGILLESSGTGGQLSHLAVGIGVNLLAAPHAGEVEDGALRPVALLSETGIDIAPEAFLTFLACAYAAREAVFRAQGFVPIRRAWLDRAARLGTVITARTSCDVMTGTFETVDEAGNLVLSTAKARHAIPAADVFFERGANASGD